MGYRIHRAMGWGMPYIRFEELCLIKDDDGSSEAVYSVLNKLTDGDLTVDDKLYRALFYGNGLKPYPIHQKRLLATGYDTYGAEPSPTGHATDLYTTVSTPDETTDIIFFPNLWYRSKWYRWDDDLDYAFERTRDADEDKCGPRDFTTYTNFGHYPWTNELMSENGDPLPWEHFTVLKRRSDWLPAVPSEIRWYLTQFGILDGNGVNQLRPVIAQWWS